jgi:hypothetical protein
LTKPRKANLRTAAQASPFRDKTRVVDLREEKASLEFLGYTFRRYRDPYGRDSRYLNAGPSKKAWQRERDRISEMTDRRQGCTPITRLIERLNRQLEGWGSSFSLGYPRDAYRDINWHLGYRVASHLKHHRSQRAHTRRRRGCRYRNIYNGWGEPDAGNPHVRFDQGTGSRICHSPSYRPILPSSFFGILLRDTPDL